MAFEQKHREGVGCLCWKLSFRTGGIAISVEAVKYQVSYAFQLEVPISVGMHRLIDCLLGKRSMILIVFCLNIETLLKFGV